MDSQIPEDSTLYIFTYIDINVIFTVNLNGFSVDLMYLT